VISNVPRQTLRNLIAKYGHDLCSDAKRCEGLLKDFCGAHRLEINILVNALEERVPLDLLAGRNAMPRDLLLAQLAKRLEDHLAITAEASLWAVESWALALGVLTDDELEKRRRVTSVPQPPAPTPQQEPTKPQPSKTQPPPVMEPVKKTAPIPLPPPATRIPTQRGATVPQRTAAPANPTPPTFARRTTKPPLPLFDPSPRRSGTRWRGCLVGCFLLVVLSLLLFFGVPLVIDVLRAEVEQRNNQAPPVMAP
jgi:hypothetical protein